MQKVIASCAAAAVSVGAAPLTAPVKAEGREVHWQCSTNSERWVDMGTLTTTQWDDNDYGKLYLEVDQTTRYQTLTETPWGGCFNERGWEAMKDLTDEQREGIINDLISDDGLHLTTGRLALGNSDFSITNNQSYDELPDGVETDYDMEYFSIENDREWLLPYIKAAQKVRPDMTFWGSPWSPPAWMKESKSVSGYGIAKEKNVITWTPEVLTAYAKYFVKYVRAYEEEGIEVSRVMPQNEPTMHTGYPSCVWTGQQLNEFIRDYLYPAFREAGLDAEIYLGTFTDSDASRTDPTLTDPLTSKIIKGLGVQWWSAPLTKRIYRNNQENGYVLMQSETKCGNGGNTWSYAEEHFDCLKEFFDAGVNEYMLWNMILDEKGYNTNPNPWPQNAPIIVNSETNEVSYSPQYYVFKHFSYYIDGGARRIRTDSTHGGDEYGDKIAFQNKDGEIVLVVKNSSGRDLEVCINFNGEEIKPTVPAHSVNTFTIEGSLEGFDDIDATYTSGGDDEEISTMVKLFNLNTPGMSLSVSQASFDNGAEIIAWGDKGAVEQLWTLEPTDDGWYKIISFNSEKSIGIYGGSNNAGTKAVQWGYDGSLNQQWKPIPVYKDGKTYYKLQNRSSSLFLTYGEGTVAQGALAYQTDDSDSDALLWDADIAQGGDALTKLYKVTAPSDLTVTLDRQPLTGEII
ncbi:MAG: RICIN domain-containing protein, partial [Clostridia bacterium]